MIDVYREYNATVMSAVKANTDEDYSRYGFAAGSELRSGIIDVKRISEKPGKENTPSDLATVSGCLLKPEIFRYLESALRDLQPDHELYYNDGIQMMIDDGQQVIAAEIQNGKYYDAGSKLEYLKTVVDFALKHDDIKDEFKQFLRDVIAD